MVSMIGIASASPSDLMSSTDPLRELNIPLFEIKDIHGKGKGLITHFNISRGTCILCEKPLIIAQHKLHEDLELLLAAKLKAMLRTSQSQFLSLHNNFPGRYPFSGIVKTNALPCGSSSIVSGVYPTACLINHSCIPNTHNSWNSREGHETIHAIRPIKSRTKITISYDHGGPSGVRQRFLKESFSFACTCSGYTLTPSFLKASDNRRNIYIYISQIQRLDEAIGDPFHMMNHPHESLQDCYSLFRVLEQEFNRHAGALVARLYYDAFQICIAHKDQARSSIFAERAYKARVICEGEDSPDTLCMKSLASQPADHSSFGVCSNKWQTTRESIPKGLDMLQFDKWLFRQEG
ncbi:hypothetical protein AJ78_08341 [Emergomyces pasteurianus Ep9510]|uniref:SET domain-containing protein n=1 Tax=Emergomyces pasteurianus Ep9510 TaxID=1447872 RepID=A0A1J9PS83_9EURO|nr:hypothetical protein AJ78_08341 [Emergomyces pasteurianus Ep9510]